jgi:thiol:disulfide interchange protein
LGCSYIPGCDSGKKTKFVPDLFLPGNAGFQSKNMKKNLLKIKSAPLILLLLAFNFVSAQVLDPVQWSFKTKRISDTEAELQFVANMESGWHIYSQYTPDGGPLPTVFTFNKGSGYELVGKVLEPNPVEELDVNFDLKVRFFRENMVVFRQKVNIIQNKPVVIKGLVECQACNEGTCVPNEADFSFQLEGAKTAPASPTTILADTARTLASAADTAKRLGDSTSMKAATTNMTNDNATADSDGSSLGSLWIFFWLAFVGGLIAILTPCVFPMIPMTVSYFLKSGSKGKLHAAIYGLSIIAIYTLFGTIITVLFGAEFSNFLSTHWIPNVLFFLIFIIFAASFFGYFEITMPSWLVNKSVSAEDKGGIVGVVFMAFTLVLVSFSCTGPIVGTILVKAVGGQILKPIIGMLGFSLAFAIPFTLLALFPRWLDKMPKSGGWLNSVKVVLGFIELAFALKFLNVPDQTYHWGILDREVYLGFWIVIFAMMGLYLLGIVRFPHDDEYPVVKSFPRLMLIIFTFAFVVYLIPGLWGAPLKAISGWVPPMETQDFDINAIARENAGSGGGIAKSANITEAPKYADLLKLPHGLQGYFDYNQALRVSKELKKPVFVDFTGHGCTNCREMENRVWSDPQVLKRLRENFVLLALYVDDKTIELPKDEWYTNEKGREIRLLGKKNTEIQIKKFGANAQPFYVILDGDGNSLIPSRSYDLDIDAFARFLDRGVEAYNNKSNGK